MLAIHTKAQVITREKIDIKIKEALLKDKLQESLSLHVRIGGLPSQWCTAEDTFEEHINKLNNIQAIVSDSQISDPPLFARFVGNCAVLSSLETRFSQLDQQFFDQLPTFSCLSNLTIFRSETHELNFGFVSRMFHLKTLSTNQEIVWSEHFRLDRLKFLEVIDFKTGGGNQFFFKGKAYDPHNEHPIKPTFTYKNFDNSRLPDREHCSREIISQPSMDEWRPPWRDDVEQQSNSNDGEMFCALICSFIFIGGILWALISLLSDYEGSSSSSGGFWGFGFWRFGRGRSSGRSSGKSSGGGRGGGGFRGGGGGFRKG